MNILSKSVKRKRRRSRTPDQLRLNMKSVSTDLHVQLSERPRLPDLPEGRLGRLLRELPCPNATGDELLKYGAAGGPIERRTGVHEGLGDGPHASQVCFHLATVLEEAIRTSVN